MKIIFKIILASIFLMGSFAQSQEISESGKLGLGLAYNYPAYGVSAKYNITETHSTQIILGAASYGFGTSSFAANLRYLYNFSESGESFVYRPYVFGQVGYFSVKADFLNQSESASTISFGAGGGIEFTLPEFVKGLAFNAELGLVGGSFGDGFGKYAGFAYGAGIYYYFKL